MLRAVLVLLASVSAAMAAESAITKFEKEISNFNCKGEKPDVELAMSLVKQKCKKEYQNGLGCGLACYYKVSGLFDEDYRLSKDSDEAIARMTKIKVNSKKLSKMLTDMLEKSDCAGKFPPKGNDDCKKAFRGTLCVAVQQNKYCGLTWEKLISANS